MYGTTDIFDIKNYNKGNLSR